MPTLRCVFFARFESDDGFALGPRVVVQSLGQERPALGESNDRARHAGLGGGSSLAIDKVYPTRSRGTPPNSYTFTGVEFGPPTGLNLFPHGGLQTSFWLPRKEQRLDH